MKTVPVALEILLSPHCPVFSGQGASLCLHGRLRKGERLLEASQGPQKRHISEINLGQELCDLFFPVLFSCAVIPAAPAHAQLCFLPTDAPTLTSISLLPTESYPPCDVQIHLLSLLPGSESFCSSAICFLPIFLLF